MSFKYILVTGSASESYVKLLIENVFRVHNYSQEIKEYRLGDLKIIVSMNLNTNLVNFRETCERIGTSLASIICIENGKSPRVLQRDLNLLLTFFNAAELQKYLKIFFVYQNMNGDRLHQLRLNMLTDDMLFNDFLQISDKNLKWQFITQNIWILHENYMQQLRDHFRQSFNMQNNSHSQRENSHWQTYMPEVTPTRMLALGFIVIILFVVVS
jgi:hypothetical protein